MNPRKIKRMAASILGVGETKVWIDSTQMVKASEAMTRDDVRGLIAQRIVRKRQDAQHSRGAARILHAQKRLGRKQGQGKRTGTKKARSKPREQWIARVRALRMVLSEAKKSGKLKMNYRALYKQVKGNNFRGRKHLESVIAGESK